jgi:hypothetical protein
MPIGYNKTNSILIKLKIDLPYDLAIPLLGHMWGANYEKPRKNAAQLLFLSCLYSESGMEVSLVTMSCPSSRTIAPPPCLPLDLKDSLKEDMRVFDGGLMEGFFDGGF